MNKTPWPDTMSGRWLCLRGPGGPRLYVPIADDVIGWHLLRGGQGGARSVRFR